MRLIDINSDFWFTEAPKPGRQAVAKTAAEAQAAVAGSPNHKPSGRKVRSTSGPVCVASPARPTTAQRRRWDVSTAGDLDAGKERGRGLPAQHSTGKVGGFDGMWDTHVGSLIKAEGTTWVLGPGGASRR